MRVLNARHAESFWCQVLLVTRIDVPAAFPFRRNAFRNGDGVALDVWPAVVNDAPAVNHLDLELWSRKVQYT